MNECKLRGPKIDGADHTEGLLSWWQASKQASKQAREAKAATIERLSLSSVPSHTRKGVNWQGHTLVELPAEYSSHPKI